MASRTAGRPRDAEVDEAVRRAALELFLERGLDGVGIDQVARRAGVTRGTVYRRYPTREELRVAALIASHRTVPVPEVEGDPDVDDMIRSFAMVLSDARSRALLRRLMTSLTDHPEVFVAYRTASIEQRNAAMDGIITRARDAGEFPADIDVRTVRELLSGSLSLHVATYPDDTAYEDAEHYLRRALAALGYRRRR